MIEFLSQPWSWWFGGIMIVVVMTLLILLGQTFGVSSTLRTICAVGGAGKRYDFFNFDWKGQMWNIVFVLGAFIGGFIANHWLKSPDGIQLSANTIDHLNTIGVSTDMTQIAPPEIFSWAGLFTLRGFIFIVIGGFLVGFGSRYAGGCTSGHGIMGIANLQLPSLIAVIGFFIGGIFVSYFVLPFLVSL